MSTAIKIKGGGNHTLSWNLSIGTDVGIDIEDSWNNLLEGNIHVSRETMQL
jgi:parallel beta-helix repeat protein